MTVDAVQVPCPDCRLSSPPGSPKLGYWECPACGRVFYLRRCKACQMVSYVSGQQRWHQRWPCAWCEHRNSGFSRLNDPAAATVADLVADIGRRGLTLPPSEADRQTQPIPILATQAAAAALAEASVSEASVSEASVTEAGAAGTSTAAPPDPAAPPGEAAPSDPVTPPVELWAKPAAQAPRTGLDAILGPRRPSPSRPASTEPAPPQPTSAKPDSGPPEPSPAPARPRRWWRGRRSAVLAAAILIILMAGPAAVLASHASHMRHPGHTAPPTSRQVSVKAGSVRTVYLQSAPGTLTIVGGTGSAVTLTGKLRWARVSRAPRIHTSVDQATHTLRLSYQCVAGSACTENYRLAVPAHTAVILNQPSGQVILDSLAGPLSITAANVNVTATGLRSPSLTGLITSGLLTASFAKPPQHVSLTLSSAHAIVRLPTSVSYTVSSQVNSGRVQVHVPQSSHSSHLVTAHLTSSDVQLQPT